MSIREEAHALAPELERIYKDLHRHPEIGYGEVRTSGVVAAYLRECGLDVTEHVALTGVVGVLDSGKPGKTLLMRADMDALQIQEMAESDWKSENPGVMHACGHDAHTTMLLGAAKLLSRHRDDFCGRIKFVFQPGEESIPVSMLETVRNAGFQGQGGAAFMIQEGVLEGVDAAFGLHVAPKVPVGEVTIARREAYASSDIYTISLVGKGGHGALPHQAVDPIPALAELIQAIHLLPAREVNALDTCVISIGKIETPGSVWNVVAEKVVVSGGFRTFNNEVRAFLKQRIREVAEGIAQANRCTAVVEYAPGYDALFNNEALARQAAENMAQQLGAEHVTLLDEPEMGSEDFGCFAQQVPAVFFQLGTGVPGETDEPLHNPNFKMALPALELGTLLHVTNALSYLGE